MSSQLSPSSLALTLLANSFYDSNTASTQREIEAQLSAYTRAPVQAIEAAVGARGPVGGGAAWSRRSG
jgi:hypothetical protein